MMGRFSVFLSFSHYPDFANFFSSPYMALQVQDAASPSAHTATASLTVSVTDLNDVTPSCSPAVYYVTVAENTAASKSSNRMSRRKRLPGCNNNYRATPSSVNVVSLNFYYIDLD